MGDINGTGYNITKWGNIALTRNFELAQPNPYDAEGIKSYALCPWFADTAMVRNGVDVVALEKRTKNRILTVGEVGHAMMRSLELDKNGAVYVMFPEVPLIEYTNIRNNAFFLHVAVAKIAGTLGQDVLTPTGFYIVTFFLLWIAFWLWNKLFWWLLCCY